MSSEPLNISNSEVEVTGISANGVWLLAGEEENLLSYGDFPQFKDVSLREILNAQEPTPDRFYWPDLDVDLGVETIRHPDRFPFRARDNA